MTDNMFNSDSTLLRYTRSKPQNGLFVNRFDAGKAIETSLAALPGFG
jgi:hypothetical protein